MKDSCPYKVSIPCEKLWIGHFFWVGPETDLSLKHRIGCRMPFLTPPMALMGFEPTTGRQWAASTIHWATFDWATVAPYTDWYYITLKMHQNDCMTEPVFDIYLLKGHQFGLILLARCWSETSSCFVRSIWINKDSKESKIFLTLIWILPMLASQLPIKIEIFIKEFQFFF